MGALIVILGAWGAGVAYFGPVIGLGPAGWQPWRWTTAHTVLNLIPGAVAVAAGLVALVGLRARPVVGRAAGLLAAACGGWFVLGASAYPVLLGSVSPAYGRTGRGALADLAAAAGYGRGVGVALVLLGGLALAGTGARVRARQETRDEVAAPAPADDADGDLEVVDALAPSRTGPIPAPRRAPTVPAPVTPFPAPARQPGWQPQFRSTISRMVPRPVQAAAGTTGTIGERQWRPTFATRGPTGGGAGLDRSKELTTGAPEHLPPGVLSPGEWVVAAFPDARLAQNDRGAATEGTAAVTNRRVIFAPEGTQDVRDWPLDQVDSEHAGAHEVIDLTDDAELDLTDAVTGDSFAAAVHAANSARDHSR